MNWSEILTAELVTQYLLDGFKVFKPYLPFLVTVFISFKLFNKSIMN